MSRYDHYYQSPIPHYDPVRAKFASEVDGCWQEWDGITKLMEFPAVDRDLPTLIAVEHNHGKPHLKVAAPFPPEVRAKIASLEYDPKGLWVVSNAMGSMETWGCNRNGDAFPKLGLSHIGDDYGHKTFEKFAFPYVHHLNKDPKNSIGEKIAFSHFDEEMDKVTLLYKLSRTKAADVCERLDKGESVATSMGCKVPFDVCSVCDHKAKTAAEYCEHCKFYPGQMLPSGVKVAMINVFPRFFDQSHVLRGADKIAFAWGDCDPGKKGHKKKAYYIPSAWRAIEEPGYIDFGNATLLAGYSGSTMPKQASDQPKAATITKEVPSQMEKSPEQPKPEKDDLRGVADDVVEPMEDGEPEMSPEEMQELLGVSIEAVMGTTAQHGMVLTPEEFQQMSLTDAGKPEVAERLRKQGWSIRNFPQGPVVLHKVAGCRAPARSDEWVVQCQTCKYANAPAPDAQGMDPAAGFWDLSPEVIDAILAWTSPDDAQYNVDPQVQQALPQEIADPSNWKVSRELNRRLSPEFIEKRSAFTSPLYRRMLSKIAEHGSVHEEHGHGHQDLASILGGSGGPVKIIVIDASAMGGGKGREDEHRESDGHHHGSPREAHGDAKDMMLSRVLYALYRSGVGGLLSGGGSSKMSALAVANPAFKWAHGVPTRAYVKYAHRNRTMKRKPVVKKATLKCDTFLLDEFIATPLLDHTKVASILDFAPDELIDAATLVGLTYVKDLI